MKNILPKTVHLSLNLIFIIVFVLLSLTTLAQREVRRIDSVIQALIATKKDSVGFSILTAEKGNIVYKTSWGVRNQETGDKIDENTVFELASVSKQFTAMGILILVQQGMLSLEDSLRKFFPELPYHNITIHSLLTHTAGLPDYGDMILYKNDTSKILNNKDVIKLLTKYAPPVLFKPYEKWEYSNTGYMLLASIIEKVTGRSYDKFLKKKIFNPLKMRNTFVYTRRAKPKKVKNYAYGYVYDKQNNTFVLPENYSRTRFVYYLDGIKGDGTVNSTIMDLLKWDKALYTEKLVKKSLLSDAFTPVKLKNDSTFGYGYGWMIGGGKKTGKKLEHSGGWPGYVSYISRYPDHGRVLILLTNKQGMHLLNLIGTIEKIWFN